MLIRDLGAQVITCTPSYALNIAAALEEAGVAPGEQPLEIGLLGAEPWSESMGRALEERLGLRARNIHGLSEIVGPGVSAECAGRAARTSTRTTSCPRWSTRRVRSRSTASGRESSS